MPYANPEDRRANYHKNRERNAANLRESYRKHREKRLAAKREDYWSDPDKMRERNRQQYAANQEARVEYARAYRRENQEEVAAKARDRYRAGGEALKERRKELRQRPEARRKAYAAMREWAERNPDKALTQHAKRLISEATGMQIRDIPNDLAEAKVEYIKLVRWVREAQGIEAATADKPVEQGLAEGESPVGETDAPEVARKRSNQSGIGDE